MKNIGKRVLCLLCAAVMLLSMVAIPDWNVQATENNGLPEELKDVNPEHIKQYDASYFTDPHEMGSALVEDSDSPLGQAYYNEGLAMGNWLSTAHRNDYGSEKWLVDVPGSTVPIDGQYHFYKYTWAVPADLNTTAADIGVYHGGKWIASNEQIAQDVEAYKGQTIDFYVSIKIDGDAASTKIYIDQMLLVEQCEGENCPVCGDGEETVGSLPEELKDVNPEHIKQYDASYFAADTFGTIVDDPESPLGKAYNASMPLGEWFEVYRYADGESILLSENHRSNVQFNAGYVFYKRTVEMPATVKEGGITYVRYNNEWVCQSAQIAKDLEGYVGKTIDFYFSAKVNGTAESCEIFIDQMIVVEQCEGENCPVCGGSGGSGSDEEEPPQEPLVGLPEELKDVNPKHIKQYDASYFTDPAGMGSVLVEDADSPLGQAYYNEGLAMGSWLSTAHRNDYGSEKWLVDVQGSTVPIDGQYHFYKYTWTVPADLSSDKADIGVYHGGKWIASNEQIAQDVDAYKGQTVDFYVSIKIDGDAASTKIYIDQMLLVEQCEGENCPVCGGSSGGSGSDEEEPPQEPLVGLPEELKDVNPKHIKQYDASYFTDPAGMGSVLVEDADSPLGQAYYHEGLVMGSWLSTAHRNDYGSEKWLVDVQGSTVPIDGQYHFYKYTWTVPADLSSDKADIGVYHGGKWIASNEQIAQDVDAYKGQTVDFYVSIKIDGDAASTKIYIDQMLLVEQCEGENCPVCGGSSGGSGSDEEEPPLDPSAGLPEELENVDAQHIIRYNTSHFAADAIGTIVEDPESPLGKAYHASQPLETWLEVYRNAGGESILLSENHRDSVQLNAGYVFYKETVELPETMISDGAFTYVRYGKEWVCQNPTLAKDLEAFVGKKIDFYFSAKINGTVESSELYLDQMIVVDLCENYASEDGTTCTKCGASLIEEDPGPIEPPVVEPFDYIYTADLFSLAKADTAGDCVIEDTTSAYGKAAMFSYAKRAESGDENLVNAMIRKGDQSLTLYVYGGDPAESRVLIDLSIEELKANAAGGEYVEYTAYDVDLMPLPKNYFIYMFYCWGLQLHISDVRQQAIYNTGLVDVTLSLKVTGDVTDPNNPPTYYIDKIQIKSAESGAQIHKHQYGEWVVEENTHSTTCLTCGEVWTELHQWDEGVVTKEPVDSEKGEKVFTCAECGGTKTEEFSDSVRFVFNANNFYLPRGDKLVTDPTSKVGVAVALSYADRKASGQVDPANALIRDLGQTVAFYSYAKDTGDNYKIGELAYTNLRQNANGGKYVTYKFKGIKITPVAGSYFLYMFDDWGFQIPLNEEQINAMLGKRMDVFLSMKVTGAPNSTSNSPVYYIDRVIIQETSSEGDEFIPYVPEEAPRGSITSLPAEYKADDFRLAVADRGSGDAVVSDPSSAYGKAACFSYEKRKGDTDRENAMIREPGQTLRMYTDSGVLIAEFTVEQLQENAAGGQYVVYEFRNVNLTGARYMYMFDCWGFQIPMEYLTDALTGKQVDIKLSMKVTGDVTKRTGNTPAYYFDYLSITEAEPIPEHEHEYGEWTTDTLNHSRTCTICGLKQEGMHTWDEGVVTKEPTETENGETVYTCKVCGMKEARKIKKLKKSDTGIEEPKSIDLGWIIGGTVAGLLVVAVAVIAVVHSAKKTGKKG